MVVLCYYQVIISMYYRWGCLDGWIRWGCLLVYYGFIIVYQFIMGLLSLYYIFNNDIVVGWMGGRNIMDVSISSINCIIENTTMIIRLDWWYWEFNNGF